MIPFVMFDVFVWIFIMQVVVALHKDNKVSVKHNSSFVCIQVFTEVQNNITSPGYPHTFHSNNLIDCRWGISTKPHEHYQSDEKILIHFKDFDLPGADEYGRCMSSYLQYGYYNTENNQVIVSKRLCGLKIPQDYTFIGIQAAWVAFVMRWNRVSTKHGDDYGHDFRGFSLTYKVTLVEEDHTRNQVIIGITIAALVTFGCCFPACVYFKKKGRISKKDQKEIQKLRRKRATRRNNKNIDTMQEQIIKNDQSNADIKVKEGNNNEIELDNNTYEEIPADKNKQGNNNNGTPVYVTSLELEGQASCSNHPVTDDGTPYERISSDSSHDNCNQAPAEDIYLSVKPNEGASNFRGRFFSIESITSRIRSFTPKIRLPFSHQRRHESKVDSPPVVILSDVNNNVNHLKATENVNVCSTPEIKIDLAVEDDDIFIDEDAIARKKCDDDNLQVPGILSKADNSSVKITTSPRNRSSSLSAVTPLKLSPLRDLRRSVRHGSLNDTILSSYSPVFNKILRRSREIVRCHKVEHYHDTSSLPVPEDDICCDSESEINIGGGDLLFDSKPDDIKLTNCINCKVYPPSEKSLDGIDLEKDTSSSESDMEPVCKKMRRSTLVHPEMSASLTNFHPLELQETDC